ncbi:hypothetical protein GCM10007989_16170 [Devosia pacifica]|uniref:Enoyl reductase (ER) domain-containing protein n=1 Tax=Devosia pacifica TaxID=1335967 RepID=A0A918S2G1_9HYPH|nr:zinc-binding alcohol dehydrogenase family protein [Devosia pacifica]GHA21600.1 hypothetical protein GCM10007989_16170 [Devosia pacifica]
MTQNMALWLSAKRAEMQVGPAPVPQPQAGEIVIRVRAVAVNPFDRLIQTAGEIMVPYLSYPAVIGSDVAGDVVAVGEGVRRFAIGDRVVGYAAGSDKARNRASEGAFQLYVVLLEHMTSPIPPKLSCENAAVLPLALCTAASALFQRDFLALPAPERAAPRSGKTVLVWGGSTSVGVNAIQLAVAAGYEVVATASPHNFAYLKQLGAKAVLDYRSRTIVADMIETLRAQEMAGAIAIGAGSSAPSIEVIGNTKGRRFVALATPPAAFDHVPRGTGHWQKIIPVLAGVATGNSALKLHALRHGVRTKFIWGSAIVSNEVGPMIFRDFLPKALADGAYIAAPLAQTAGHGLDAIPMAFEQQKRGVSAAKIVVTL